jgi:hypothetical protein
MRLKSSAFIGLLILVSACVAIAEEQSVATNIFDSPVPPKPINEIDRIVFAKLSSLNIQPVLCSDSVFVRRAYLDVIGTIPTAEEARAFIEDTDTENKRRLLIDRLLERDEYADYWSMRWGDILRIKAEFPINLWPNAAQSYHRWLRASIVQNKPYDQFARELLTSSGSNFRVGPVNFYRALQNRTPEGIANAVALTFMGSRTDAWPEENVTGLSAFFAQIGYKPTREWKEQVVFWDPLGTATSALDDEKDKQDDSESADETAASAAPGPPPRDAIFPDGTKIQLPPNTDPREVFADWLITPENPWFTRAVANRMWSWLVGRGVIHEPDDIRNDNPPSNPELLAYLEKELIENDYDLKHLCRLILNSSTYQFSSTPRFDTPEANANFATYPLRRLDAEVLIDAINEITGTTDLYTSAIPEPFTYIPKDLPAIAVADGSITSPFLALFGRSARATGMENERDNNPVAAQSLHMLNSSHIQSKLEQGPKLRAIMSARSQPQQMIEQLYLAVLSRLPTEEEVKHAEQYAGVPQPARRNAKKGAKRAKAAPMNRRNAVVDITWALINSTEFLYRH